MDYNDVLEFHVNKRADITVVVKEMPENFNVERYGTVQMDADGRIQEFVEKPVVAEFNTISCGIYVIRRRLLIEFLEKSMEENRYDFVQDILIRYRGLKRIYGYKLHNYWSNIATVEDYYKTNMDFLNPEIRDYFFKQYPEVHSKVADLPPAKYNVKKTKNVTIKDMTHTSSWRLESPEDVENVLDALRKSLLTELNESDIVNVEF